MGPKLLSVGNQNVDNIILSYTYKSKPKLMSQKFNEETFRILNASGSAISKACITACYNAKEIIFKT